MKMNVINHAVPGLFNSLILPETHPETAAWIANQFVNTASTYVTEAGRAFIDRAQELYKKATDNSLEQLTRRIVRSAKGIFNPNAIMPISSFAELQSASRIMQRYLMAQIDTRGLFNKQLCDGYSDSYVDLEPGKIGDSHYDYRRVMQGVLTVAPGQEDEEDPMMVFSNYGDDLRPDDRELDIEEQHIIINAWEMMKACIREKIDPTDIFNGKLEI